MAFDDEDDPNAVGAFPTANNGGPANTEDALEDDGIDHKLFMSMFDKTGVSNKAIRKGEKDFESHGTRAQDNLLEASRKVLEDVLGYTRIHREDSWMRGWCFPDWWAETEQPAGQDGLWLQERVVMLEHEKGVLLRDLGRVPPKMDRAGTGRHWLLPEEAIFLVERGNLDLWWPERELEELFPKGDKTVSAKSDTADGSAGLDDFEVGLPLSLEAAYSLLIGLDGERGKISLPKYQVFSHLKRAGFLVLRAQPEPQPTQPPPSKSLWQWLFSFAKSNTSPRQNSFGPLVQPGLYRAYGPIYHQLALLPRHKPLPNPPAANPPQDPYKIFYHVWKTGGAPFAKRNPPPPDFRIAVVEADDSCLPTFEQIEALLASTPYDPPGESMKTRMYQRLKHGHRNVLVAIVDRGLVNFMRFGEGAFGEELLVPRFDIKRGARGGKRGGGRGRGRGRGRGGRGRGR